MIDSFRHAQNILLHIPSAEIVHIDLGVAFEQVKSLRVSMFATILTLY